MSRKWQQQLGTQEEQIRSNETGNKAEKNTENKQRSGGNFLRFPF